MQTSWPGSKACLHQTHQQVSSKFHNGDFALLTKVSRTNTLIVHFIFLDDSSLARGGGSTFGEAGQNLFLPSQEELLQLVAGGNSGVDEDETKDAVMDDETGHLKRVYSNGSDLSNSMQRNA